MAEHSYTSRRELDQYGFHPAVTLLVPVVCILLQVVLPKTFPRLAVLDLPLIAVIFFSVARRSQIAGTIGFAVDVENLVNRIALNFCFSLLQSGLLYLITRWLLGDPTVRLLPVHELIRAASNTVIAIPMFYMLDRFRTRE